MTQQNEPMHIGIIKVSRRGFDSVDSELSNILNIDNVDTQGTLRDNGVFSRMHQVLMLPESYRIIAIICDGPLLWKIFVESNVIPPADNASYPEVSLTYQRDQDGSVSLSNIEIISKQGDLTFQTYHKL
jgi:hypothetical protein